ncbi:hypothetical protein [Quatrionicoccus australiensis]|uniref:hypothetical protein n=1 Tax=Quatrionicoccus australiensis TaxID=138118 RepID=UPI001CF8E0BA|nr:hypothetical protein [Quatrionicoccus australiensis]UCV14029.1 hypothetical protein KI612_13855 [Quatrionicoccus australiensis]
MITMRMISRWNITVVLVISTCAVLSGCMGDMQWSEDVVLADGKIITVSRRVLYERGGGEWASNRSGTKPRSQTIGIPLATNKVIEWTTTKISPSTWPEIPLLIEIDGDRPVVYTLLAVSLACERYSKYVFHNGRWVEEALPNSFPIRPTNLLFGNRENLPSHVSVEEKKRRNGGVYRRTLKQVGPSKLVCG